MEVLEVKYERLTITLADGDPPSEFRLFTAGKVDTTKGEFLFDVAAAKSVMAAYADQGNELMIDYDHASLDGIRMDPALSGKAAGWFGLEVRDGELWATNVRWTEPAADALKRREWRYMSPAFTTKGKRILSLINVAITNIPATKRLEPLMAASTSFSGAHMDKILSALGLPADASEDAVLKRLAELSPKETQAASYAPAQAPDRAAIDAITREAHREVGMQSEIATLREQQRVSTVREILRSTDRHITPAFESVAQTMTPDAVRALLLTMPQKPSAIHAPSKSTSAELTPADLRMCRLLDQKPEELRAYKAAQVERAQSKQRAYAEALAAEMGDF